MGKIIVNEITDKELISKIYKHLKQLNTIKMNNPITKWAKELNRHLSKADMQMDNKYMKRCSASRNALFKKCKSKNEVSSHWNGGTTLEFLSSFLLRAPPLEMRQERREFFPDEGGKGSLISSYEAEMGLLLATIKKSTNNKCWRACGEKGALLHCWWECKLVQPL